MIFLLTVLVVLLALALAALAVAGVLVYFRVLEPLRDRFEQAQALASAERQGWFELAARVRLQGDETEERTDWLLGQLGSRLGLELPPRDGGQA